MPWRGRWFAAPVVAIVGCSMLATPASAAHAARTVPCGGTTATVVGTRGNDVLHGDRDDVIAGLGGDDVIVGGLIACGGPGDDRIRGTLRVQNYFGGPGDDRIRGRGSQDVLVGGAGDDLLVGGADTIDGVAYSVAPGPVYVNLARHVATGQGIDRLLGIEVVIGSRFDDVLVGDARPNQIEGRGGDDRVRGLAGADQLFGERGNDVLRGNAGNDFIRGARDDDTLWGQSGDDDLSGNAGTDALHGGAGTDTCAHAETTSSCEA